jgi:hypothetical protein
MDRYQRLDRNVSLKQTSRRAGRTLSAPGKLKPPTLLLPAAIEAARAAAPGLDVVDDGAECFIGGGPLWRREQGKGVRIEDETSL